MLQSCTAVLHGHRVSYHRAGEGSAIVLLHGIGSNALTWEPVGSALAEAHDVIAPDFLSHGASAKPRGDYSLGAFASGVRDLLQLIGIERATIVGHSLGGGVAMQLAYQHPELCERLVLVSSGGLGHSVSPLLRAAALPGSEWVLPLVAGAAGGLGARWAACSRASGCARATTWPRWGAAWPTSETARHAWPSSTPCAPWWARAASA